MIQPHPYPLNLRGFLNITYQISKFVKGSNKLLLHLYVYIHSPTTCRWLYLAISFSHSFSLTAYNEIGCWIFDELCFSPMYMNFVIGIYIVFFSNYKYFVIFSYRYVLRSFCVFVSASFFYPQVLSTYWEKRFSTEFYS